MEILVSKEFIHIEDKNGGTVERLPWWACGYI